MVENLFKGHWEGTTTNLPPYLCYYFQSKNYLHILLSCLIDRFAIYRCKPSLVTVALCNSSTPPPPSNQKNMTLKEYSQDSTLLSTFDDAVFCVYFYEFKRRFCNFVKGHHWTLSQPFIVNVLAVEVEVGKTL